MHRGGSSSYRGGSVNNVFGRNLQERCVWSFLKYFRSSELSFNQNKRLAVTPTSCSMMMTILVRILCCFFSTSCVATSCSSILSNLFSCSWWHFHNVRVRLQLSWNTCDAVWLQSGRRVASWGRAVVIAVILFVVIEIAIKFASWFIHIFFNFTAS